MRDDDKRKMQGARLAAARTAAGYRSAREAALENSWPESSYRAHENGTRTIGLDDADRYARVFRLRGARVDAQKILFGSERERAVASQTDAQEPESVDDVEPGNLSETTRASSAQSAPPQLVYAAYGGKVEAGSWREVDDLDFETAKPPRVEKPDPDYPHASLFYLDVQGDSMNDLKPRPILPGDQIVVLDYEGLGGRVPLRNGMVVVVEQTKGGGHIRERSVKQVELQRDRTAFCPRSTNPGHKPILVPYDTAMGEEDTDGRMVRVVGWVRRITNDVPGW